MKHSLKTVIFALVFGSFMTTANIVKANEALVKAYKHCIVANSIKPHLVHHGAVLMDKHPVGKTLV